MKCKMISSVVILISRRHCLNVYERRKKEQLRTDANILTLTVASLITYVCNVYADMFSIWLTPTGELTFAVILRA